MKNRRIEWLRVFAILMVVWVHGENLFGYIGGDSKGMQRWLSPLFQLSYTGVPLFVAISAYLLFKKQTSWLHNFRKKTQSILLPCLMWNVFFGVVEAVGHTVMPGSFDDLLALPAIEIVKKIFWLPFSETEMMYAPFWFMRDLFWLNLAYPVFYYVMKRFPVGAALLAFCIWFSPLSYFVRNMLSWFMLGGLLGLYPKWLEQIQKRLSWPGGVLMLACSFGLALIFDRQVWMERVCCLLNVVGVYGVLLNLDGKNAGSFQRLQPHVFMIYVLHGKILSFMQLTAVKVLTQDGAIIVLEYLLLPALAVLFSVCIAATLNRWLPGPMMYLTGGRSSAHITLTRKESISG